MRIRMASFSWPVAAMVFVFASGAPAAAQQVIKLADGETLTISGFISATLFNDRGLFGQFGQGQNAEWAAQAQPGADQGFTDGDVRNTRIRFEFASQPMLGKWAPRASSRATSSVRFPTRRWGRRSGMSSHSSASASRTPT